MFKNKKVLNLTAAITAVLAQLGWWALVIVVIFTGAYVLTRFLFLAWPLYASAATVFWLITATLFSVYLSVRMNRGNLLQTRLERMETDTEYISAAALKKSMDDLGSKLDEMLYRVGLC